MSWGSVQYQVAYQTYLRVLDNLNAGQQLYVAVRFLPATVSWLSQRTTQQAVALVDIFEKPVVDLDHSFRLARSSAYDLWTWADRAANACWQQLRVDCPTAPGFGPPMNQLVQSVNYKTGVQCAMLQWYGFAQDATSFAGFDT